MNHPHLMSPLVVAGHTYKHRMVASPALAGIVTPDGAFPPDQYKHYEAKAAGGCAAVTIGETEVNFTYGNNLGPQDKWPMVNEMKENDIHAAFERAKEQEAEFIIALPHWGVEYQLRHSSQQERWAKWLIDEGADVIVGGHPHVVQDTTHIKGVPVFYSLGNAVSNMSIENSRLELAVTLRFVVDRASGKKTMLEPQLDFMWCTLPGNLTGSYATIYVKEWANRKDDWLIPSDFENMIATYDRVKAATGIED